MANLLETPPATRTFLEREYAFIRLVSTFLQAVRIGAVHLRHCAIVLTHYGRLGPAVDSFSKAVGEILKDEGLYKDNGAGVHDVITEALQEVRCSLYSFNYLKSALIYRISVVHLVAGRCRLVRGTLCGTSEDALWVSLDPRCSTVCGPKT